MSLEKHNFGYKAVLSVDKDKVFCGKSIDPIDYNRLGFKEQEKQKNAEVDTSIFSDEDWDYLDELIITRNIPTNIAFKLVYEAAKRRLG